MADEKYRLQLEGSQIDDALLQMNQRVPEGWAVGTRDGSPVGPGSQFHQNNAKYYAEQAGGSLDAANAAAARAEAAVPAGTAGAVFFDTEQSLTDAQKAVARNNIDAASASDSNVVKATPQTFTPAQQSQIRANIMAGGSNRNLLDNAYFVGGGSQLGDGVFPINQRGLTYYESIGNYFDRWKSNSPWASPIKCALQSEGVVLAGDVTPSYPTAYTQLSQILASPPVGKTVTLSILTDSVTSDSEGEPPFLYTNDSGWTPITVGLTSVTFVWASGVTQIGIILPNGATSAASLRMQAIKLEVGSVSTIQNDAPPDFGEELRKCQRSFVRLKADIIYQSFGLGITDSADGTSASYTVPISLPVALRTATTNVTWSNLAGFDGTAFRTINSILLIRISGTVPVATIVFSLLGSFTNGQPVLLLANQAGAYIDISAEL